MRSLNAHVLITGKICAIALIRCRRCDGVWRVIGHRHGTRTCRLTPGIKGDIINAPDAVVVRSRNNLKDNIKRHLYTVNLYFLAFKVMTSNTGNATILEESSILAKLDVNIEESRFSGRFHSTGHLLAFVDIVNAKGTISCLDEWTFNLPSSSLLIPKVDDMPKFTVERMVTLESIGVLIDIINGTPMETIQCCLVDVRINSPQAGTRLKVTTKWSPSRTVTVFG